MRVVFHGGRIVTAGPAGVIENGVLIVDDERISELGAAGEIEIPTKDAQLIDTTGQTVIPGLIDLHGHVCGFTAAESAEGINPKTVTESVVRATLNCRGAVTGGVTTVRDVGARHEGIFRIAQAVERGDLLGPRIVPSGSAIAMTGGHGYASVCVEVDGADACRAAARQQLKNGAEVIKLMASGGAGGVTERLSDCQLTVEELTAASEEAHKKGKTVAVHATGPASIINALNSGADTIEHGVIVDDAAVAKFLEKDALYVPTLEIYNRIATYASAQYPPHYPARAREAVQYHRESFQKALAAGVKIGAGTDSGNHRWFLGDLALELQLMVEYGLDPLQAILTATKTAAEAMKLEHEIGTLETGKSADVVVVNGNPLDQISALRQVASVMKNGQMLAV